MRGLHISADRKRSAAADLQNLVLVIALVVRAKGQRQAEVESRFSSPQRTSKRKAYSFNSDEVSAGVVPMPWIAPGRRSWHRSTENLRPHSLALRAVDRES